MWECVSIAPWIARTGCWKTYRFISCVVGWELPKCGYQFSYTLIFIFSFCTRSVRLHVARPNIPARKIRGLIAPTGLDRNHYIGCTFPIRVCFARLPKSSAEQTSVNLALSVPITVIMAFRNVELIEWQAAKFSAVIWSGLSWFASDLGMQERFLGRRLSPYAAICCITYWESGSKRNERMFAG